MREFMGVWENFRSPLLARPARGCRRRRGLREKSWGAKKYNQRHRPGPAWDRTNDATCSEQPMKEKAHPPAGENGAALRHRPACLFLTIITSCSSSPPSSALLSSTSHSAPATPALLFSLLFRTLSGLTSIGQSALDLGSSWMSESVLLTKLMPWTATWYLFWT